MQKMNEFLKDLEKVANKQVKLIGVPHFHTLELYYEDNTNKLDEKESVAEIQINRYVQARIRNITHEINKLEAAERFLTSEEVVALIMLRGRQRELNSMLGKLRGQTIGSMIKREEEQHYE